MDVRIAARARADLLTITEYIAAVDHGAAEALLERFLALTDTLVDQPLMDRPGRSRGLPGSCTRWHDGRR